MNYNEYVASLLEDAAELLILDEGVRDKFANLQIGKMKDIDRAIKNEEKKAVFRHDDDPFKRVNELKKIHSHAFSEIDNVTGTGIGDVNQTHDALHGDKSSGPSRYYSAEGKNYYFSNYGGPKLNDSRKANIRRGIEKADEERVARAHGLKNKRFNYNEINDKIEQY